MKHSAESISLQQTTRSDFFCFGHLTCCFSARLGLKFLVCLCFALGGRLTRDSKQSKQALVPKVYLPRGETGNVYSSSSDGIYLVVVVVVGRLSQPFPYGEKKFLVVCLSLVGRFIFRVVALSSPITLELFPITITNPIQWPVYSRKCGITLAKIPRAFMDAAVSTPDIGRHINGHCNTLTKVILPASPPPHPSLTTTKKQRKSWPETNQKVFFCFSLFPDWRSLSSGRRTRNHSEYMIIKSTGTTPQMCAEEWWNDDNNNNHNHLNHKNNNNNNNHHHHAKSVIAVDSASMMEKPLPSPLDKPLPSVRTAPDRALVRMKHRMVRHHRRWAGSKQF